MQCTATNKRNGRPCRNRAINGTTKCRMHGGKSLAGIASPSFRTGRYSKALPARLATRYSEALSDPKLLELRDEIALIGLRNAELLTGIGNHPSHQHWEDAQAAYDRLVAAMSSLDVDAVKEAMQELGAALAQGRSGEAVWEEIAAWTELRRKLVDTEHKRMVAMQQMITTEQAMGMIHRLLFAIKEHVSDTNTLTAISAEFTRISESEHR